MDSLTVQILDDGPDDEAIPVLHLAPGEAKLGSRFLVGVVLDRHQVEEGPVGFVFDHLYRAIDDDAGVPEPVHEEKGDVVERLSLGEGIGHVLHRAVVLVEHELDRGEEPDPVIDCLFHFRIVTYEHLLRQILGNVEVAGARVEGAEDDGVVATVGVGEVCVSSVVRLVHGLVVMTIPF